MSFSARLGWPIGSRVTPEVMRRCMTCPGEVLQRMGVDQDPSPVRHDDTTAAVERLLAIHDGGQRDE